MVPGGSRTIGMFLRMSPGLDSCGINTDPDRHLMAADIFTGSAVPVDDLYRDMSDVWTTHHTDHDIDHL